MNGNDGGADTEQGKQRGCYPEMTSDLNYNSAPGNWLRNL